MKIFYHVYVSSAAALMPSEELLALLNHCQSNNAKLGLTGILLHKDGNFMQILEGPEPQVREVLGKIYRDSRHCGIIKLLEGYTDERQFSEWAMGFHELNSAEVRSTLGYSEFMNLPLTADSFGADLSLCERLLRSFKKIQR